MFERQRMILKSGMQVGLRRMARVTGLGEQREIGQAQLRHQAAAFGFLRANAGTQAGGIDETTGEGKTTQGQEAKRAIGGTHHNSLRTAAATCSAPIPSGSSSISLPSGPTTKVCELWSTA